MRKAGVMRRQGVAPHAHGLAHGEVREKRSGGDAGTRQDKIKARTGRTLSVGVVPVAAAGLRLLRGRLLVLLLLLQILHPLHSPLLQAAESPLPHAAGIVVLVVVVVVLVKALGGYV